jgi:hypothetical protein
MTMSELEEKDVHVFDTSRNLDGRSERLGMSSTKYKQEATLREKEIFQTVHQELCDLSKDLKVIISIDCRPEMTRFKPNL